jgi:cyclomaltodextrinase
VLSKAEPVALTDDHGVYGSPGDVTPWDIRFDPSDRAFCDSNPDGSVRIRVWTDPSLSDGMLVVRAADGVAGYRMTESIRTIRFIFWEVVAGPLPGGAEYTFAFKAPNGRGVYRVPSGVASGVERIDRWQLENPDPFTVPSWSQGAVIYQIFPDRFARQGVVDDPSLDEWGAEPDLWARQGGDLPGITERLGYLSDLGVDVIYLNPIFTSPSNHRYDTVDYLQVDPLLGGNQALKEMVTEPHARSVRVILDASYNHVHPRFFAFVDVVEKGPDSPYWDWFVVDEWPVRIRYREDRVADDPRLEGYLQHLRDELGLPIEPVSQGHRSVQAGYDAWYGVPTMPRVNLANPGAREYMLEVAAHWPREFDTDGWRMDVVRYVDPDFWDGFRETVRRVRPDAYLLAEVMGDTSTWLQGDRFDATMNYTFRDLCLRFFADGELDGRGMIDGLSGMWAQYAWPVTLANQNLLGSHDTPRFLTESGGEVWRLRLATVLQLTFPGAPGIYYGDEVGLEGHDDPGCRGAFPWDSDPAKHVVHQTIRQLTALRRSEPALTVGEWRPVDATSDLIVFERVLGTRRLVVGINRSSRSALIAAAASEILWGEGRLQRGLFEVAPRSAVVAV